MVLPTEGFRPRHVCPMCKRATGAQGHYSARLRAFACPAPEDPVGIVEDLANDPRYGYAEPLEDGHARGSHESSAGVSAFLPWIALAVALGIALALWLVAPSVPPLPR